MILVDTGPLVALIDRRDAQHQRCVSAARQLPSTPLVTTWPCVTESMHFLARASGPSGISAFWQLRATGQLHLQNLGAGETDRIIELMERYQNVPMDFADASLVAAAEGLGIRRIFTLDSDFRIYRLADGSTLDVIP